ncbi:unnamed protein product, partial [marine sediment metagenome]
VMWGDVTINNSTIADNYAEWDGGGIWMHAGSLEINNSIVALNTADDGPDIYGTVDYLRYSLVSDTSDAVFAYDLYNEKDVDPEFVRDPSGSDWGDLRITAGSPARNWGHEDYAVDEDGVPLVKDLWLFIDEDDGSLGQGPGSADEFSEGPRIVQSFPDMGAYELDIIDDELLWYDRGDAGYQESDEIPYTEVDAFYSGYAPNGSVTGHVNGITGIVIDAWSLAENITETERVTVDDFIFRTSTSQGSWTTLSGDDLPEVAVDRENDKIILTWGNNEIENMWLEVSLKANANTGLVPIGTVNGTNVGHTFYFGSLLGDISTNIVEGEFVHNTTDLTTLSTNYGPDKGGLLSDGDLNLDGDIDNTDLTILSTYYSYTLFQLYVA